MDIGKAIKSAREAAGFNQAQLAASCGWESQGRVSNYERGQREPTLEDLARIARATNVRLIDLVASATGKPEGPHSPPPTVPIPNLSSRALVVARAYDSASPTRQKILDLLLEEWAKSESVPRPTKSPPVRRRKVEETTK